MHMVASAGWRGSSTSQFNLVKLNDDLAQQDNEPLFRSPRIVGNSNLSEAIEA